MMIVAFNLLLAVTLAVGWIGNGSREAVPGAIKLVLLVVWVYLFVTVLGALP